MKAKVSLTRMELLRLRKRQELATRGHKLLQDKLEGLVARFLILVSEYRRKRAEVSRKVRLILQRFSLAGSISSEENLTRALRECRGRTQVRVRYEKVMNVRVPRVDLGEFRLELAYSLVETPAELDLAADELRKAIPEMLKLAEMEEMLRILAIEIAKTRRRVNSLRYVIIPQLDETIKDIKSRLEELDRQTKTQLLKIKEILEEVAR